MKLKLIILVLIIASFNYSFSQTKELYVEYDFYFKDKLVENKQIQLRTIGKESLSTTKRIIMTRNRDIKTGEISEVKPHTSYRYVYKNNNTNSLQYSDYTPGRGGKVYIKETIDQFNWTLTGNKKTILNYSCQEAMTTYRGRDYVAYFTTQLPYKAAPWKFHGLPGVMLEIRTTDDKIKMEAKTLKIQPSTKAITDPFSKVEEFITSWDDFKELYKKRLKQSIDKNISKLSSIPMSSEDRARIGIGGVDMKIEIVVPSNALSVNEQREARKLKK
jgi:GLPGLI family protein